MAESRTPTPQAVADADEFTHAVDDHPGLPWWSCVVEGLEIPSGTILRGFHVAGRIKAEGAGEALDWLINHGPIWDGLDGNEEITITIKRAPEPDGGAPGA